MNAPKRERIDSLDLDDIVHKASNEALSIAMGVHLLSTLPEEALSPQQVRAMKLLEVSSQNLMDLMDDLKSTKEVMMSHEAWLHQQD